MSRWPNPLVPGFNPDPSVVLVDGTYYLATSTFEYLPGLPIYRSTDLVEWTHIGNVATRPEQVAVEDVPTGGGVWAPTIRHHDGVFYLIVTIAMSARGCVVFTATDPAGPWSDGTTIDGVGGIDPDLAWDDEGNAYVTYSGLVTFGEDLGKHLGIQQVRVDLEAGKAMEEPRSLWSGTGLKFPEAPHVYQRGDHWYLMIAEGGTERGHGVSFARGPSIEGPFESHPDNPLLSARSTSRPIQNTGHADLVDTPDGGSALIMLGMRPLGMTQSFSPLGRETFITDVAWADGWPEPEPVLLAPRTEVEVEEFDFADTSALDDPGWLAVRTLPAEVASLTSTPGPADDRRRRVHSRRQPPAVRRPAPAPHQVDGVHRRRRDGRRRWSRVPLRRAAPRLARGARQWRQHPGERPGDRRRAPADLVGRPARPRGGAADRDVARRAGLQRRVDGRRPHPPGRQPT